MYTYMYGLVVIDVSMYYIMLMIRELINQYLRESMSQDECSVFPNVFTGLESIDHEGYRMNMATFLSVYIKLLVYSRLSPPSTHFINDVIHNVMTPAVLSTG